MGYSRVIIYGRNVDVYRYFGEPRGGRSRVKNESLNGVPYILEGGEDVITKSKSPSVRSPQSVRRAVVSFGRLICANLGRSENPLFASFTYRQNMGDISRARKDFNAFAKRARQLWGNEIKYISVFEYQKRGAIHFHSLLWGLPSGVVVSERSTRLVASLWKQGFVDIMETDGHERLAWYLAKYMGKTFADPRLSSRKAYITSRNILRPIFDNGAILSRYFTKGVSPDLSTATLLQEKEYNTQWLGRANYQQYQVNL